MNIDELLNSNANLEDYLNEYYENPKFIFKYYLQDLNRITKNFYQYSAFLNTDDTLYLFKEAVNNHNYEVINVLLREIDNIYLGFASYKEKINKIFYELIELDKENKIDINKLNGSIFLYRSNPLYFVKKNPNNIRKYNVLDIDTVHEVLKYLVSINYTFSKEDEYFITNCILPKTIPLIYFLNYCKYDPSIDYSINLEIDKYSNDRLYCLYNELTNCKNTNLLNILVSKLNYNNFDYQTIVKDKDICLKVDNNKEKTMSLLKKLGKNYPANIILVMDRVNMDIVNEAYSLVGDSLKILPLMNQMHKEIYDYHGLIDHPYYDYNYIKQSEDKLNLYASMVNDTKDKDGDIKSLSPLEKFVAAYILTSKFAPYKEDEKHSYKSRSVYEFINSITGTSIVCGGYTHLLREILYRMGITDTMDWSVNINNKNSDMSDHARMMIHLVDPKYGIDGIYMSDPTFDNSKYTELEFKHMLMSHDELLEVDKDLTLDKLRANETLLMENGLHINDAYSMFRKRIPKDVLIKAHLAVEHFISKNMKMVKDNNYDFLEYSEMADKLHFFDINLANQEKIFNELKNMSINEIEYSYPGLLDEFLYDLSIVINNKLQENGVVNSLEIRYNHEEKIAMLGYKYRFPTEEFPEYDLTMDDINELTKLIPHNIINKRTGEVMFYIEMDNNRKVSEQFDELIEKLNEIYNICQNITGKYQKNEVK